MGASSGRFVFIVFQVPMRKSISVVTVVAFVVGLICSIWLAAGVSGKQSVSSVDHQHHHGMVMEVSGDEALPDGPVQHCIEKCQIELNLTSKVEPKKLTPSRQVLFVSYVYLSSLSLQLIHPERDVWHRDKSFVSTSLPVFAATNRLRI